MAEHKIKQAKSRSRAWWAEKLDACEKSGLSMVAFARANGLNLHSFYNWKRTLVRNGNNIPKRKIEDNGQMRFVEFSIEKPKSDSIIEFLSPSGWAVRAPASMDADTTLGFLSLIGKL
jgi:hypothetical protein